MAGWRTVVVNTHGYGQFSRRLRNHYYHDINL